ncbi:MAG: SURF1 family protein [Acidimicrobiales bacterium]
MYSFLWRPKWILSHVLIVALIVAMILLMFWQLRRLDEKKTLNALIAARADVTPGQLVDVLSAAHVTKPSQSSRVEFRATVVSGTYLTDQEFTVPSKTLDGAPGRLVVTPLQWSPTEPPLLVLRGFVPQAVDDTAPPIDGVEPPTGTVEARGWLRETQTPEGLQSKRADLGHDSFARLDIDRIEAARHTRFMPAYLQLGAQAPPTASEQLSPYPLPERSEGPHFSYAVQWAVFSVIAAVGYPLVLRRVAHGGSRSRHDDVPYDDLPHDDVPEPV